MLQPLHEGLKPDAPAWLKPDLYGHHRRPEVWRAIDVAPVLRTPDLEPDEPLSGLGIRDHLQRLHVGLGQLEHRVPVVAGHLSLLDLEMEKHRNSFGALRATNLFDEF